jgi:hypothetical protein
MDESLRNRIAYEKQRALELQDCFTHESMKSIARDIAADAEKLSQHRDCSPMAIEALLTCRRVQLEGWLETWGQDAIRIG